MLIASPKQLKKKRSEIHKEPNCTHSSLEAQISEVSEQQRLSRKGSCTGSGSSP